MKLGSLIVAAVLLLTACGEAPWDRRDREKHEDTIRWLEQQELKRIDRERGEQKKEEAPK